VITPEELIRRHKLSVEVRPSDGAVGLRAKGKLSPAQIAQIKAAKDEIVAILMQDPTVAARVERARAAVAERQAAEESRRQAHEAERQAIIGDQTPIVLQWHDGEYLSGWEVTGPAADILESLGVAKYVDGWGYHVGRTVVNALGESFVYSAAVEYARPARETEAAREVEAAAKKAAEDAARAAMNVRVLRTGKEDVGDGPDHFAEVEVTDPATGESARFRCRNVFDFGYVVNPMYPLAPGRDPGGLPKRIKSAWVWEDFEMDEDGDLGWVQVRSMTGFEIHAIEYLNRFPPIGTDIRM